MAKFKSATDMTDAEIRARQKELRTPKRKKIVASEDDKVRQRQARAQSKGQLPRGSRTPKPKVSLAEAQNSRATTGNKNTASLRGTFKGGRDAARSVARTTGRIAGSAAAETAGIVSEGVKGAAEGSGLLDRAKTATTTGASKASQGLKAAGDAARSLPGKLLSGAGQVAKFAGSKLLGPAGLLAVGAEGVRNLPIGDIPEIAARANPLTAPIAQVADAARGLSPLDSAKRAGRALTTQPLGETPRELFKTPEAFEGVSKKTIGELTGLNKFVGDPDKRAAPRTSGEGIQDQRVTSEGIPGSGLLNPDRPQANFATQTPGADTQEAGRASGLPQSGTGFFVNSKGERVNLGGDAAQPGLRAAAAPEAAPQTQNEELTQVLADQARGGGLSSAFGAIASGGNVLREQAANRQRQFQTQEAEQTQQNKIQLELTKAAAKAGPDREKQFAEQTSARLEALTAAEAADDDGASLGRLKDSLAAGALRDIEGADAAIFSGLVSDELTALSDVGNLKNLIGLGPGRNLFDLLSETDEPVVTLNPENSVVFDRASGKIVQQSNTSGEGDQELVDFDALPKRTQDFLRAKGILLQDGKLKAGGAAASGRQRPQKGLRQ